MTVQVVTLAVLWWLQTRYGLNEHAAGNRVAYLEEEREATGKPLYLLTSNSTASAAEEFTGNFAGYRLGEVIGETTAGAGFAADLVPIRGDFVLSISIGRVVLAGTVTDQAEATALMQRLVAE